MTAPKIPSDLFRERRVRDLVEVFSADQLAELPTANRRILDAIRHPTGSFALLRGVGMGSDHHANAERGVASADPAWVLEDYPDLELPPATYWSDPSLKIAEAFQALDHAFGGDHPQDWERAQGGVVLVREFQLRQVSKRPLDADLIDPGVAWRFVGRRVDRTEYLVFAPNLSCSTFSPLALARFAADERIDAEALLAASYLVYLKERAEQWSNAHAGRLLAGYAPWVASGDE